MTPRRNREPAARWRPHPLLATAVLGLGLAVVAAACGDAGPPDVSLPADADAGRQLARDSGCASCHGQNGEGGVGPAWVGLAGSTVALKDGTSTVADAEYLRRSITDPQAEITAGAAVKMPTNTLTVEQVDAVVAYIQSLS